MPHILDVGLAYIGVKGSFFYMDAVEMTDDVAYQTDKQARPVCQGQGKAKQCE